MPVNRRSAPRRVVVSVARSGNWGAVEWVHTLECGHTESRKRAEPVGQPVGCVKCVLAEQFRTELSDTVDTSHDDGIVVDEIASIEAEVARIRASVAAAVNVPVDAVDIVWGATSLQYAMVMLTATDVDRLLRSQ